MAGDPSGPAASADTDPSARGQSERAKRSMRSTRPTTLAERALRRIRAPVTTGLALALAFPPFDVGALVFVAPVPLLVRWRDTTPRRAAFDGFLAGVAFFGVLVVWTVFFGAIAYVPFVAVLAAYWAAAGALVGALSRRGVHSPWVVAAVWVLFEALRGRWPFGGFSWGELGYATHGLATVRALAGWGGVLLVSLVAVVAAGYLATTWTRARAGEWPALARPAASLLALGVATLVAAVTLPETAPTSTVRVAIVQGNDVNRELTPAERRARYLPRNHLELAAGLGDDADLVVLPESSLDAPPTDDPWLSGALTGLARRLDAAVLSNAAVRVQGGRRLENTNFLHSRDGDLEGTYVKQHLVPFGEFVPGRSLLEGLVEAVEQVPLDYAPGDREVVFEAGGTRFGNLICFESAFTGISRSYARDGAEFLVVSTNNRSFRRSANAAQHVAIGRIRAVETGRPVVHAAISGISAFVEPDGDVVESTELFKPTTLVAEVTGRRGRTPYVRFGDWVVVAAGAVVVVAAVVARRRERFDPPEGRS